jgi:hypothetical protein
MKVKLYLFTHPQWHLVLGYNKVIAPIYILSQIELEAKGYGIKHSIANIMNQLNNQGMDLLLLVSKQNLKPSSWRI